MSFEKNINSKLCMFRPIDDSLRPHGRRSKGWSAGPKGPSKFLNGNWTKKKLRKWMIFSTPLPDVLKN